MNKKIYILLFFVTLLSFLVGCEKEDNKEQMKINSSELTMNVGDVITLEVSNASGDVIFISSDESVVECNNAQITAISAGVATVTVSDDDESLNCVINVVEVEQKFDGAYVINVEIDFVDLIVGDEYQLAPVLMLGLDVIENVNYKYTSTNESVAKVENGKIKALKLSTLDKLCKVLECQPADLLEYVDGLDAFTGHVIVPSSVITIRGRAFAGAASVTLLNPNGWWYSDNVDDTSGTFTLEDMSDPSVARKAFQNHYWHMQLRMLQ